MVSSESHDECTTRRTTSGVPEGHNFGSYGAGYSEGDGRLFFWSGSLSEEPKDGLLSGFSAAEGPWVHPVECYHLQAARKE